MGKRGYAAKQKLASPQVKTRSYKANEANKIKTSATEIKINAKSSNKSHKNKIKPKQCSKMADKLNFELLIQTLPSFDGKRESNINFYVSQFDLLAEKAEVAEPIRLILLKAKFSGVARDRLLNSSELYEETDYKKFKDKILTEFKIKRTFDQAQSDFINLKQDSDEKIEEFARKFNSAANSYLRESGHKEKQGALDFLNSVKLTRFLEAIKPEIAFEIRKQAPKNYEEALKHAITLELAFKMQDNHSVNNLTASKNENLCTNLLQMTKDQSERIINLEKELNNLKVTEKSGNESKNRYCWICSLSNHDTDNCRFNGRNKKFSRNNRFNSGNYNRNFDSGNFSQNFSVPQQNYSHNFPQQTYNDPQQNDHVLNKYCCCNKGQNKSTYVQNQEQQDSCCNVRGNSNQQNKGNQRTKIFSNKNRRNSHNKNQ